MNLQKIIEEAFVSVVNEISEMLNNDNEAREQKLCGTIENSISKNGDYIDHVSSEDK